uniref:Splicing factor, arginine/serine-rich 19 n=1 Tax=Aceria tosichella TaxID=561515 RepID=A0A6G1S673_9ACAR
MEASSLLENNTPPLKSLTQSPEHTPQSNDNQNTTTDTCVTTTDITTTITTSTDAAAATTVDDSPAQQSMTISKDEDEQSSSRVSIQVDEQQVRLDNQHDSSIKLKRCKHGRIIIKDLSKKKLAQQSDNSASTFTSKKSNESNNNHISSGCTPTNDNETENELSKSSGIERLETLGSESGHDSLKPKPIHSQPQPHTPPNKSDEQNTDIKPANQISPSHNTDKRGSSNHRLVLRARARSRSSNESLSPPARVIKSTRSPPRRSRFCTSPARRERSSSRDRDRSRRRCNSPSPRRRDRSSSSRRKRRQGRNRSPSRRQRRTPDRHRRSDIQRGRGDSPTHRSPNRKLPRSRSPTPTRARSTSRRRSRRDGSRSVSKDRPRYERYSHISRDRSREQFDSAQPMRSPVEHRLRTDAIDSAAVENYISTNQNNHDNHSATKHTVAPTNTKSTLAQVIAAHQPSPRKFSPEEPHLVEASPGASPAAPSPATPPSDDESASSDIYDPEGPIIPISPCDSPPISPITNIEPSKPKQRSTNPEKNGDDDVPSSAVQLNQQEKYLQKLNRQERVIEEVKVALRPFYQNRSINKEQYKDVLRRAVPKICHSKNGEINPIKIRALVDAYVKKMKHH